MSPQATTEDRVLYIVAMQFGADDENLAPEKKFSDFEADSLDRVEMVMAVEDEFEINMDDDEAYECETVGDFIALVERLTADGPECIDDVMALDIATDEFDRTPELFSEWLHNACWTCDPQPVPMGDVMQRAADGEMSARDLVVLLLNGSEAGVKRAVHELRDLYRAGRASEIKARAAQLEGEVL